jgi:O-antigen ligase
MSTGTYPATLQTPSGGLAFGLIDTPLRRLGAVVITIFLFFAYGRILDFRMARLHIPYALSLFALFCAALSGGLPRALLSRIGVFLTALTAWMVLCVPFAFWRSNSLELITNKWFKAYMLAILLIALLGSVKECHRAMNSLAYGTLLVALLALYFHATTRGRLILPETALNNPNDLAQVLLMGLPFLIIMTFSGNNLVRRIFASGAVMIVMYVILKTASRGALITIAVCGVLVFFKASMLTKFKLVALGMIGMLVFVATMPPEVRSRYMTLFSGSRGKFTDSNDDESAIGSTLERKAIMIQAVKITLRRPLFGVGPGNFTDYSAVDSHASGVRAHWRVTHNTYLEWSSECGFPGVILFLAGVIFCLRRMSRVTKRFEGNPATKHLVQIAGALQFSLLTYCASAFFSSTAYEILFPTLAGLTMAFLYAIENEQLVEAPPPAPVGWMPPQRKFIRSASSSPLR